MSDHRNRPGPQPHNQIAGDFLTQLARARLPRPLEPLPEPLAGQVRALIKAELLGFVEELPELVGMILKARQGAA